MVEPGVAPFTPPIPARYRLRFLLQEFDLCQGSTTVGRGAECHVTLTDALVSRCHARIDVIGELAVLYDLGSRNGVKVNGRTIRQPTGLRDRDRLRLGLQELVFCNVSATRPPAARTTGFLRHCGLCEVPYPREAAACPKCGDAGGRDEETSPDQFCTEAQGSTELEPFLSVLEAAVAQHRFDDADQLLKHLARKVDESVGKGERTDPALLSRLADCAAHTSLALADARWSLWLTLVYCRLSLPMPSSVCALVAKCSVDLTARSDSPARDACTLPVAAD